MICNSYWPSHSQNNRHEGSRKRGAALSLGAEGERLAANYLLDSGFDLLHRNWRSNHHELDLVARKAGILHFVEVKSRSTGGLTTPEEALTPAKFRSLCAAARAYIAAYRLDMEVQFDLITVEFNPDGTHTLRYLPDAIAPRW